MTRCAGCDAPGAPVCTTCRFALVGRSPRPQSHGVHAAVPFTGRARDVVLGLKYRNRRQVGRHLAGLVVNQIVEHGDHTACRRRHVGPDERVAASRAWVRPGRTARSAHRCAAGRARAAAARSCAGERPADGPDPSRAARRVGLPGSSRRARAAGPRRRRRRHDRGHDDARGAGARIGGCGRGHAVRRRVDAGIGEPSTARGRRLTSDEPAPPGRTVAAPPRRETLPIGSIAAWESSIASSALEKARRSRPSKESFPTSTRWVPRSRLCPTTHSRPRPTSSASGSTTVPTSTTCSSRRSPSCARRPPV